MSEATGWTRGAGILVRWRAPSGVHLYLLQKRGPAARSHPGTWDLTAGGELLPGEDPLDGALRELTEEMGPSPVLLAVTAQVTMLRTPGPWTSRRYTAFLADAGDTFTPSPPDAGAVAGWKWFASQAIRDLDLHPAFAAEARHLLGDCFTGERTDVASQ